MKIKRFEALSMTEALRMVKKEFGEDAVILSAANVKKTAKIFGSKSKGQVVVTAAIDTSPAKVQVKDGLEILETNQEDMTVLYKSANADPASVHKNRGMRILEGYQPITKTGRDKLKPKLVQMASDVSPVPHRSPEANMDLLQRLYRQGLSTAVAGELAEQTIQLMDLVENGNTTLKGALAQVIAAKGWSAPGSMLSSVKNNCVVLVGTHGTGKTSAAVKLAAQCMLSGMGTPTVVTLDTHRAGAVEQLDRMTRIMGVKFHVADERSRLDQVRRQLGHRELMIVDTPGVSPGDNDELEVLSEGLKGLKDIQVHQVIHAGLQEKVIAKAINFFRPLGVSRLFFTHLDLIEDLGPLINQMEEAQLPVSFLGAGALVPDGLLRATPDALAQWVLTGNFVDGSEINEMPVTVITQPGVSKSNQQYVANCNSDIFHEVSCKSVQRMNPDHILAFADAMDAKAQGFKPCRMCCSDLLSTQTFQRQIRTHQFQRRQVV